MKALRYPHEERGRSPPDFDRVVQPFPYRPEVRLLSVPGFWVDLVGVVEEACSAVPKDAQHPWISPGRLPLLCMVSSFGLGKTLALREAARYLYKFTDGEPSVPVTKQVGGATDADDPEAVVLAQPSGTVSGRGVVVQAANFNVSYRVSLLERIGLSSREDGAEFKCYLLLYVCVLFNELVDLSDPRTSPSDLFTDFLKNFYGDHREKQFTLEDVCEEVKALVESRAGRGSDNDVVAFLVDEIGKLRTGIGGQICSDKVLDLRFPTRSEACSIVEAGSGLGVAYFVVMESSLMLSERSASGRAAEPLMALPPGDLITQKIRLLDAMCAGAGEATGVSPAANKAMWRLQVDTGTKISIERFYVAEVNALLGGMLWRSVELFVEKLLVAPKANLVKVLMAVDSRLVTDSMDDDLSYSSFWEHRNSVFRDNVLAATLLPVEVLEESLVIRPDGISQLLSDVRVDATVERTGVIYLAGAGASTGGWTINDLLGGKVSENIMCQSMFKLPHSASAVDGVGFRRALNDVPGVVSRGELDAEWCQEKHSKPSAATVLSASDVKKSLENMGWVGKDAAAMQFYGGPQGYGDWGRRSIFVYAGLRKVSVRAVNHPLAANAFVLDGSDLYVLLGHTMYCLARALYLLLPTDGTSATAASPRAVMPSTSDPSTMAASASPSTLGRTRRKRSKRKRQARRAGKLG
ncbi:hypothetical protein I4F81_011845 [Pyropia yezoensis]|uniref:Uncharacterized protein n=1 Tax=Pyropia yezoensis TaxID=2788 RepID=A0ACC3CHN2_PYRYE|nr:hypothetical protein I4F81_011845 [Neopyropia yezoensis]